jgi:hypothetical protein
VRGADYTVIETRGRAIDLAADIEPLYHVSSTSSGESTRDETTDEELRAAFARGENRYQTMLKLSSRWAARGMAVDDIVAALNALLDTCPNGTVNADGINLRGRVCHFAETAVQKFGESRRKNERTEPPGAPAITLEDFYAVMPMHAYVYTRNCEIWPAASINSRLPCMEVGSDNGKPVKVKSSQWLDQNRPVEQLTWAPGEPQIVADRLVSNGGWIQLAGVSCFNLYLPPHRKPGEPNQAEVWIEHVQKVFGDDATHIIKWLAHRVQFPGDKINHALLLGGAQGVGKDTILEPIKHAVGPWNFVEVSPTQILGRFNGFLKSVILRVSEARDLGDFDRFGFYDHMKSIIAAPPDVLRCDEKNIREHSVFNITGVVITSNNKSNGIYLPPDDRRHFVAWSSLTKEDFSPAYWQRLWGWYARGGIWDVSAYLAGLNLADFDSKAPPPKTAAFWDIVDAHRAPEDAELADAIDALVEAQRKQGIRYAGLVLTLEDVATYSASDDFRAWLRDRRNSRQIPHRFEAAGYVPVRNTSRDGYWKIGAKRVAVYGRKDLSEHDRQAAAAARVRRERG